MISTGVGLLLSEEEQAKLSTSLSAIGLDDDAEWDSLDVACALTVLEHSLGIILESAAAHPRQLRTRARLINAVHSSGIRQNPGPQLTLDLPELLDESVSDDERERRRIEYRLALAFPGPRIAVSRRGPLRVVVTSDTAAALPLARDLLAALPGNNIGTATRMSMPFPESFQLPEPEYGPLAEQIEAAVREFTLGRGGQLWPHCQPLISVSDLRELGYLDAHPEQVLQLSTEIALLPAACLGSFAHLGRATEPVMATFGATVFRREPRYDASTGRLPAFTCREILWSGDPSFAQATVEAVTEFLSGLANSLGLQWRWASADDPFFLGRGTPAGKRELRAETAAGEIALASVNRHGRHFAERKNLPPGWTTGCAGLGLERWALAAGFGGA